MNVLKWHLKYNFLADDVHNLNRRIDAISPRILESLCLSTKIETETDFANRRVGSNSF